MIGDTEGWTEEEFQTSYIACIERCVSDAEAQHPERMSVQQQNMPPPPPPPRQTADEGQMQRAMDADLGRMKETSPRMKEGLTDEEWTDESWSCSEDDEADPSQHTAVQHTAVEAAEAPPVTDTALLLTLQPTLCWCDLFTAVQRCALSGSWQCALSGSWQVCWCRCAGVGALVCLIYGSALVCAD